MVGESVAEISDLVVAGVAGDKADDLERHRRDTELPGEKLNVAGQGLGPRRGLGGATQATDEPLTVAPV